MPGGILLITMSFSQRVPVVWAKMTAITVSPIADLKGQKNMTVYELKCQKRECSFCSKKPGKNHEVKLLTCI
jgi:hypothetical protein